MSAGCNIRWLLSPLVLEYFLFLDIIVIPFFSSTFLTWRIVNKYLLSVFSYSIILPVSPIWKLVTARYFKKFIVRSDFTMHSNVAAELTLQPADISAQRILQPADISADFFFEYSLLIRFWL